MAVSRLLTVAATGSTNADMLALARAGEPEGSWLAAETQTAGRGRQGRPWTSPPGNLHASTLVRLRETDPPPPALALVAGVALEQVLAPLAPGKGVCLKWPNDVLLGGAKLAGILLEREGDAVVVGFGANLAHAPDLPDRPTASLAAATGHAPSPADLLAELEPVFAYWLGRWRGGGRLDPVRTRWLERAHHLGAALSVRVAGDHRLDGLFDGLDGQGALRLRLADGTTRVIHAGDVSLA